MNLFNYKTTLIINTAAPRRPFAHNQTDFSMSHFAKIKLNARSYSLIYAAERMKCTNAQKRVKR